MNLKDVAIWNKGVDANTDPYGSAIFSYAKSWAELLEARIPESATSEQVASVIASHAKEDSHKADTEGITGFMYGAAVSILSRCWIYGEELRRWHNLDTQLDTEGEEANKSGGTLNPAIMNIGERE